MSKKADREIEGQRDRCLWRVSYRISNDSPAGFVSDLLRVFTFDLTPPPSAHCEKKRDGTGKRWKERERDRDRDQMKSFLLFSSLHTHKFPYNTQSLSLSLTHTHTLSLSLSLREKDQLPSLYLSPSLSPSLPL
jgi:hypothetical protein